VRSLDASHTKVSVGALMPRFCQGNCTMGGEDDAPAPPPAANARARDQSRWCIEICCGCRQRCRQDPRSETHLPAQRTPVDRRRPRQVRQSELTVNDLGPAGRRGSSPRRPAAHPLTRRRRSGESPPGHLAGRHPRARRAAPGRSGDRCRPAQVWFRPLRSRFVADDPPSPAAAHPQLVNIEPFTRASKI
jgi:hypothetical protein